MFRKQRRSRIETKKPTLEPENVMKVKSLFAGLATGILTAISSSIAGLLGSIAFFGRNPYSFWGGVFGAIIGAFVVAPLAALYGLGMGSWEGYKKSEKNTFSIEDAFSEAWSTAKGIFTFFKDRGNEAPRGDNPNPSPGSTTGINAALGGSSNDSRPAQASTDSSSPPYHKPRRKSSASGSPEPESPSNSTWFPD